MMEREKLKRPSEQKPDPPEPSCASMKSDRSMGRLYDFKAAQPDDGKTEEQRFQQPSAPSGQPAQKYQENLSAKFTVVRMNIYSLVEKELKNCQKILRADYPECLEKQMDDEDMMAGEVEEQTKGCREAVMEVIRHCLRKMSEEELANTLQNRAQSAECRRRLKSNLKRRFHRVFEGIAQPGKKALLNEIYTELFISKGATGEVNDEHEIRQIENAFRKPKKTEITIKCKDIFQSTVGGDHPIRTVMTKGVAGIGKTMLTQKFTLDWAEDKTNQDVLFIFPFTFRELNVLKEKSFSLVELVHYFFAETKETGICSFEHFQVVFIFDGLDECRLPLDFNNNKTLTDVTESTSVDVLLTNLIRGKLLPSARLWITTRPAAANQIPPECVDMMTEVRGFTDPQKEEYFRKRSRDEEQASRIISHVGTLRSLHIMCHIPVFCWITATVLEELLKTGEGGELPNTLTEMYIHFLVVQAKQKKVKYDGGTATDSHWCPESRKMIESLGKLAFEQLLKGNLIFYESDLTECGIDIRTASVYSGVFTQIFKEESGLYQNKVFCFVHLSVQEFLAALHVHLTFVNSGKNLLSEDPMTQVYQSAVDEALQSPNGHLDLFLRFLLGLSLQTNQSLLQGLLTQTGSHSPAETVLYIKKKIRENSCPEKSINLFHCLSELRDRSLVEEIQQYLSSGSLFSNRVSPDHWSALVFILLSSEKDLDVFDLKKYSASEEALVWLTPVVKASKKALLNGCKLSQRSCEALASLLSSKSSNVKELDLSNNDLQDSGVKLLCDGLQSPHCALETLRSGCSYNKNLKKKTLDVKKKKLLIIINVQCVNLLTKSVPFRLTGCNLSERSCEVLATVLSSESSSVRELDLNNNDLQDSGVKLLCAGLKSPQCALETLRLSGCLITKEGCTSLASALSDNPTHLRELDLSYNHPGDSGVQQLSAGLKDPQWALQTLRMDNCGEKRLVRGVRKYACELTLDPVTAHQNLKLMDNSNQRVIFREEQLCSDHPDRFDFWPQVLCRDGLTGRSYWEAEWLGDVCAAVTYRGIRRRGDGDECRFGGSDQSWSLRCSVDGCFVYHNGRETKLPCRSLPACDRVAVYLDCPAGTLTFYRVSCDTLIPLHTFYCTFTEPLYPAFGLGFRCLSTSGSRLRSGSSVILCSTESAETSV
ncbi:protein NLRC3-like isoform X3 [Stegastes partitus]|uniref:Protein NLRC3-like isoform X3 n=1 Tax=Stegastes partitus TaxID=144197 RepID=A0A9Y4K154_9TELE|nr:PREDICTED: protein NLRC3-like isoform X3 [Stegastes partitus]